MAGSKLKGLEKKNRQECYHWLLKIGFTGLPSNEFQTSFLQNNHKYF